MNTYSLALVFDTALESAVMLKSCGGVEGENSYLCKSNFWKFSQNNYMYTEHQKVWLEHSYGLFLYFCSKGMVVSMFLMQLSMSRQSQNDADKMSFASPCHNSTVISVLLFIWLI